MAVDAVRRRQHLRRQRRLRRREQPVQPPRPPVVRAPRAPGRPKGSSPTFTLDAVGRTFVRWQARRRASSCTALSTISTTLYRTSAFAICPLLAGTGEQVKIVDAMAHGLAVVATRSSASSSPIVDGVNGYVVDSAEEFADRVDRALERPRAVAARWVRPPGRLSAPSARRRARPPSSSRSCDSAPVGRYCRSS